MFNIPFKNRLFLTYKRPLQVLSFFLIFLLVWWGYSLLTDKSTKGISDFETCAKAGYPVLESYPRQCITSDKKSFTEQLPTPTPTLDSTANWKTYTNTKHAYEIKHPIDWSSDKCPQGFGGEDKYNDTVYICSSQKIGNDIEPIMYFLWITKYTNLQQKEFKELVTEGMSQSMKDGFNYTTDQINGLVVLRTTSLPSRSGAESAFFKDRDGNYISISFTPFDKQNPFPQQDNFYQIFNQILQTFRFLDNKEGVACTQEVKLCPDGNTYVGRTPPNCEFSPCPGSSCQQNTDCGNNQICKVYPNGMGRCLKIVSEGEYCEGRNPIATCASGLKCQQSPGTAADAPGICVKQ